jgi:hypothetical protein
MRPPDTDAVFTALRAADPDVMDRDELAELTGQLAAHRAWCDALQVRIARRQRCLADEGRAEPARDLLSRHGQQSSKDAQVAAEREQVCTALPSFEDALATGAVSAGHVDAIANATRNLDDQLLAEFHNCQADLLADAATQSVDAFERGCRDLAKHLVARSQAKSDADELDEQRKRSNVRRWTDKQTGMCHTHLELDPIRDRTLWAAIDSARATLRQADGNRRTPWAQLEVDAVIAAIGGTGDRVPQITALIDHHSLVHQTHANTICETDNGIPLPVSTVRRLCCDAEILPVVLNGNGQALDVGRSKRTATRAQRRALRAMHRTCAHPDCTVTFDACRIHHVIPWLQPAGDTDIDNLLPLCETHHHMVHEGSWGLTMTPNRTATWTRPDGTHHHTGPTIDRAPNGVGRQHERVLQTS